MTNPTTMSLEQLVQDVEAHLYDSKYSKGTIDRYRASWRKLLKRCRLEGVHHFSYEICLAIIKEEYHIPSNEKLKLSHVFYLRTVKVLDDFKQCGHILKCHQKQGTKVTVEFVDVLQCFIEYSVASGLSERTIGYKTSQLTRFLNDIYVNGIIRINQLTAESILLYLKSLENAGYARTTISGILFTLRSFLSFLYEREYITAPLQNMFPVIFSNKMERIPSYYDEEELKKVLSHVNRDDAIGKRDYLILLLAIQLGIRAGDIRMMKLEYIHWNKNTIEFIQQKTRNPIQLPLPENIKYAMIDYIRNGRIKSELPFIFLRQRAPYEPYGTTNVFHYVITRYMKEAGISFSERKHGLHSMRHSLASNLLKSNVPYPVITGILGHENTNTTRSYLAIDIVQLRSIALEVPYEE